MQSDRAYLLDSIRGATLVSMILYHGCWDLHYLAGMPMPWYEGRGAFFWQQSICWTFILLSGFCMVLSKHGFRRGLLVSACGLLVTLVTVLLLPENRVMFGVLSFLGAAMLWTRAWQGVYERIPPLPGLLVHAVLFAFTRRQNTGFWGLGHLSIPLPKTWFRNLCTAALGFPPSDFVSTDYFSFFPWVFLFLTGFFLGRILFTEKNREKEVWRMNIPGLSRLGRYSLPVYMLHQPILYLGTWLWMRGHAG